MNVAIVVGSLLLLIAWLIVALGLLSVSISSGGNPSYGNEEDPPFRSWVNQRIDQLPPIQKNPTTWKQALLGFINIGRIVRTGSR
ncbi:MAG: hypothetical protein A3B86_00685 [Candidatus Yanofskybacteria bacterium RIFCSPHIGHO2_02_FULL_38_22b]|uniref:Uncharacterized protein n=1 Tax=Candidatus Yanofskybacteria bacterium RIFCSPHIGHO2_02_FULL_38_22b TaxID=1802673 RepID=A0A1F8F5S3_9BACT|nr:MAG: hypothetical protein A2816_03580 [Candidatus Yanofskybacteria bacterium RIFCSPHIGHO2_01_FULL_39_44]OGN07596.1 MAG: hypothetical protein A3B86_00685 [Candidatus Yanofskybacteria bacterium RIFCSPHIGHO2_02_FULL_38_22b]OGN20225.1 MAG: hypothetical protein A2910_00220 [Candidatus Yanofskybacteria bacterium RIFCSPLOWO2_01_FULL_39_28]